MPEGGKQTPLQPSLLRRTVDAARYVISGVSPNTWFGPLQPVQPMAPDDVKGRAFDYPTGYNLNYSPRANESVSFSQLRTLADSCDILRSVIETRKDQMEALEWTIKIKPDDDNRHAKATADQQARIKAINEFLQSPDKENTWEQWLRMWLEDMFVIDAAAIYKRQNRRGELYALEIIDGSTIKVLLDGSGRRPIAPDPAYQQVLHGVPAVDYTSEELLYLKHNPRSHKVYGYSHVEQVLVTANILIRRTLHQLEYYRDGSQPDALLMMPKEWSMDQVNGFQKYLDALLTGNSSQRRKVRVVPESKYQQTKEPVLKDEYDEFLARIVCFVFSLPPTAFVKQVNRATAESSKEQAREEGLTPVQNYIRNNLNRIIATDFQSPDLVFDWLDSRDSDPKEASAILVNETKAGLISIDEAREQKGLDPLGGAYAVPMLATATGYVAVTEGLPTEVGQGDDPAGNSGAENADRQENTDDAHKAHDHSYKAAYSRLRKRGGKKPVPFDRKATREARAELKKALAKLLKTAGKDIAAQVRRDLQKLLKDDDDRALTIADSLDLSSFDHVVNIAPDDIARILQDSGQLELMTLGISDEKIVDVVNDRAVEFARDRAAEMIGKRYNAEGELVDSANAEMVITDATRDMVRRVIADGLADGLNNDEIADLIAESGAFSEDRAQLIADTEIASANSQGALMGMKAAKENGVKILKSWYADANACPICQDNADQGAIPLEEDFDSGDDAPPGHPGCECVLISEREEDSSDESDGGDNADAEE